MTVRECRMPNRSWLTRSVQQCTSPLSFFRRRHSSQTPRRTVGPAQPRAWRYLRFAPPLLFLATALAGLTQNYSIDWYKVAGGGGASTGGVYSVSGTIGQHDAGGPLTGGPYSLTSGFWALISLSQTPGAPPLNISHSGNTVTVYWQAVAGWSLQQNSSLNTSGSWSASGGVTTANGTNYLSLASPTGNLFFRLSHP